MFRFISRHLSAPAIGFAFYGACALISQLVLLQELLIVFAGHELFLGFSLASWMGWVGAGSWAARRRQYTNLNSLLCWVVPLLITSIIVIRLSKCLFGFGMLIGLLPMLALTALLLAPIGLAAGLSFTWGCVWANRRHGMSIGGAYLSETVGAALGGVLYTACIAGRLSTDWIIALLAVPICLIAAGFNQKRRLGMAIAIGSLLAAIAWAASPLPRWSRAMQWRGYSLLTERVSRYSHLALTRIGNLTSLFENGVLSSSFPDPAAYEELVHWPLLAHKAPQRVLVIGSAATGTLTEILKHPVAHVDYVELDPAILSLLRPALDRRDLEALNDRRVSIIHQDGRRWLNKSGLRYDAILLQLPEPYNAQINRLYTLEAFRAARKHLAPHGIFAFTIPSSENYLSPERAYFNACIYRTLEEAFPSVEIIAGSPLLLLSSQQPISIKTASLIARYRERRITSRVVVPSYMPIKLDQNRRELLLAQLESARAVLINRDFFPICYAYAWRVWVAKFVSPAYFLGSLILLALLFLSLGVIWRKRIALRRHPESFALFTLGVAGLVYETVLLLAFQSLSGYLYWQLGALFAAFMLGLALGSGLIIRRLTSFNPQRAQRWLRRLMLAAGLEGVALIWILPQLQYLAPYMPQLIPFSLLLTLSAFWLGLAFPLASRLAAAQDVSETAGSLYAADLWGASLGAVLTSSALIPLIGLTATIGATGGALLISAGLLPSAPKQP